MANRTFGGSALKNDDLFESNDSGEIKIRQKIVRIEDSKRISEINDINGSSIEKITAALKELENLGGVLKKGSALERSVINYLGSIKTSDISKIIEGLENLESKSSDDFDTSAVPIEKIKELIEEYQEYLDKGLSEEQALEKIYENNKGKFLPKEIENFVQKQRDIYQEKNKAFIDEKVSKITDDLIKKNDNLEDKKQIEKIVQKQEDIYQEKNKSFIDEKVSKITDDLIKKNDNLEDKKQIEKIVKNNILENRITIGEELGNNLATKEAELEIKNFIKENKVLINEVRVDDLEERIKKEIKKENPVLSEEQKIEVKNYVAFVKNFYKVDEIIDRNINEAVIYSQDKGLGDGQIEVGLEKLNTFTKLLENPKPISNLVNEYKSIVENINWKLPVKIKECDNLGSLLTSIKKSEKFEKLVETTQKILHPGNTLIGAISSKLGLEKVFAGVAEKLLGVAGEEFIKNSLVILSQKSLEQGSFIILQSFIGGGSSALAVTAATITLETATAAAAAANAAVIVANTAVETATLAATAAVGTATEVTTAATLATATANAAEATAAAAKAGVALKTAAATLAKTTATAGASATATGTAAAAGLVPGIGWVIAAVMAVSAIFKPAFDKVKNFLSKIGLNFTQGIKDFISDNFGIVGKFGSFVINLAEDVVIMAGSLVAMAAGGTAMIAIIIVSVFGGLFGYQTLQGSQISSLVPPKGTSDYVEDGEDYDNSDGGNIGDDNNDYDSIVVGNISVPVCNPSINNKFILKDIAFSIENKVPYNRDGDAWRVIGPSPLWWKPDNDGDKYPYKGMDCAKFVSWVWLQCMGMTRVNELGSTYKLVDNPGKVQGWQFIRPNTIEDLQVGDIFFRDNFCRNDQGNYISCNHVVIYMGKDENGNGMTMESTRIYDNPHRDTVYLIKNGGIFLGGDKSKIGSSDEERKVYDKTIRITNVFTN